LSSLKTCVAALVLLLAPASLLAEDDLLRLIEDLGGANASKRSAALTALRTRKDRRVALLVERALPRFGNMGRYYAVMVLDGCPPKDAKPVFRRLLGSEDAYLSLAGATALYRIGERHMIEPMVRALHRKGVEETVRVRMLYRVAAVRTPEIRKAIRRFVAPGGRLLLLGAALSVLNSQQDRAAMPLVRALYEDDRPGVTAMAAAWLFRFDEAGAAEVLAKALATGRVESMEFSRVYSLLYSAPALPGPVLTALAGLLEDGEQGSTALMHSIRLLSKARYRKAVGAIRRLLAHRTTSVAKAAFDALLELEGGLDAEALRPLLASDEPERRLMGADALRRLRDHSGLPIVLELLAKGETGDRSEAARVLGGFRVVAAVEPLLTALADRNSTVRMRAQHSLSAVLGSLFPYRRIDLLSTGYAWSSSPEENRAPIAAIWAFWEQHKSRDW